MFRSRMILLGMLCASTVAAQRNVKDLGHGKPGSRGTPKCDVTAPKIGAPMRFAVSGAPPNTTVFVVFGLTRVNMPIWGGRLVPSPDFSLRLRTDRTGCVKVVLPIPKDKRLANLVTQKRARHLLEQADILFLEPLDDTP